MELHHKTGGRAERFRYRNFRLERTGFVRVVTFEIEGASHRYEMTVKKGPGHAAVVLPVDWRRREVYLIDQPRFTRAFVETENGRAALARTIGDGWVSHQGFELDRSDIAFLEVPAGMIDDGEAPETAAARELQEETGLIVDPASLELVAAYYPSVGTNGEMVHGYIAPLPDPVRFGDRNGEEAEQITVWKVGFDELYRLLDEKAVRTASANLLFREIFIRDRLR